MTTEECFYGIEVLEPSSIEVFDRDEGPRIIDHVNHPMDMRGEDPERSSIWLKTYGLKAFLIHCKTSELEQVIQKLNLKRMANETNKV